MISKEDKVLLKAFVDNKPLMEAVRRVITSKLYQHGGVKNSTKNFVYALDLKEDDATYGRKVKLIVQAIFELEQAYQEMVLGVAAPDEPREPVNEAR